MTAKHIKCPKCGCGVNVEFAAGEEKRKVPCPGCSAEQPVHVNVEEERRLLDKETGEYENKVVPVTKTKLDEQGNPVRKKKGVILELKSDGTAVIAEDYGDGGR